VLSNSIISEPKRWINLQDQKRPLKRAASKLFGRLCRFQQRSKNLAFVEEGKRQVLQEIGASARRRWKEEVRW